MARLAVRPTTLAPTPHRKPRISSRPTFLRFRLRRRNTFRDATVRREPERARPAFDAVQVAGLVADLFARRSVLPARLANPRGHGFTSDPTHSGKRCSQPGPLGTPFSSRSSFSNSEHTNRVPKFSVHMKGQNTPGRAAHVRLPA